MDLLMVEKLIDETRIKMNRCMAHIDMSRQQCLEGNFYYQIAADDMVTYLKYFKEYTALLDSRREILDGI